MMRMFAWCGMNAPRSSAVTPAVSRACLATFAISQTAQRNTVWPSWRIVGQGFTLSRYSSKVAFMPTASHLEPSEPQTVAETPGSSLGPSTAAPAPSPSRNEIERSFGCTYCESFSAPTTSTYVAVPLRMSASAWAMP
jgi:hypothetical protein